jgi:hypothetical protein
MVRLLVLLAVAIGTSTAWRPQQHTRFGAPRPQQTPRADRPVDHVPTMFKLVTSVAAAAAVVFAPHDGPAWAADRPTAPLIYKSGKNPLPPNPPDSKEGTKKDTTFLRCMSNCKSNCQKPGEGLAKLDCLQDCQDQCCKYVFSQRVCRHIRGVAPLSPALPLFFEPPLPSQFVRAMLISRQDDQHVDVALPLTGKRAD